MIPACPHIRWTRIQFRKSGHTSEALTSSSLLFLGVGGAECIRRPINVPSCLLTGRFFEEETLPV